MLRPALGLALALAALSACPPNGQATRADAAAAPTRRPELTDEDYVAPTLPRGFVVLKDAFGNPHRVDVEIAATAESRTRGLMWRRELADGKGMLFIFPEDEAHTFWMRNTLIPLDMLFIAKDGKVVGVVQNAEPRTLTARGPADRLSRYVLEVPGGWTARKGIKTDEVRFELPQGLDVQR